MLISALIINTDFSPGKIIRVCVSINHFYCIFELFALHIESDLILFCRRQLLQSIIMAASILPLRDLALDLCM